MSTSIFMNDHGVYQQVLTVNTANGLHLVPCSRIAELAQQFDCEIVLQNGSVKADAKAIFELMGLGAEHGTQILVTADGEDAELCLRQLTELFENDFNMGH